MHAFIIGQHGDSEVPVWSSANIAGMRLPQFCAAHNIPHDPQAMENIFEQIRDAAYRIIERKGATYYAVAAVLMRITQAILRDQGTVLSVSSLIRDYQGLSDVCFSLPTVVDRRGVEKVLRLELDPAEIDKLRRSAEILRRIIKSLELDGIIN